MEDALDTERISTFELLVQRRELAAEACAHPESAARLLPRLVGVSAAGILAYAVVHGTVLTLTDSTFQPVGLVQQGWATRVATLALAYGAGLFGAQVVSLPSAYFYALQSGVRTHGWRIAVEAMRAQASAAVVLLGLLPVYFAAGLGTIAMSLHSSTNFFVQGVVGYTLPFVGGLVGTAGLVRAFSQIAAENQPTGSRSPWPVLLVLAWSALFTALAPLGVARVLLLWNLR